MSSLEKLAESRVSWLRCTVLRCTSYGLPCYQDGSLAIFHGPRKLATYDTEGAA
ncbi:hypothetical protein [Methyloglobulus sp.]|uniref:hypothetical protein n=1 Tax=Methyloglobulus sp. TaxID=2518622 RepID=UPI0032B7FF62